MWKKYDKDCSGYIEADELKAFLSDLLARSKKSLTDEKLIEYTDTIVSHQFQSNQNVKLDLKKFNKV